MLVWIEILRWFLIVAAVGFLISGIDDLFVDSYYYFRRLYRWLFVTRRYPKLTLEDLQRVPEKPVAILVPAWREHEVITKMLENTLRWVEYRNYEIFVGTYPNDEPTMLAVSAVQESDPRVHRALCPHDGPTNKADCLNWVLESIRLHEKQTGKRFEIFVIHDAEDIVHPLSLRLMNYLIPRAHMVQLPVTALEMPLRNMTAGTYLDEFAEFHTKDLLVRERVARMIPSAGVGTGFSREALEELAKRRRNQLFSVETFTEDYDIGFRLKALGKKSILLQFTVERTRVVQAGWFRKREKLEKVREFVATREFFPSRFSDAVRQKTRWIFGIVFQGWKQLGWPGRTRMRYMLWRDRKALISHFINIVGYVFIVLYLGTWLVTWLRTGRAHGSVPVLVEPGSWLWTLIVIDTVLMLHRMLQRVIAVSRISDWKQALLSIPRLVWGNIINFWAVCAAMRQFVRWAFLREKLAWVKTPHAFPTEAQLLEFRRKLGDLLLESRLLSLAHLQHALELQRQTGERLGDLLMRLGYVQESALMPVLSSQLRIETRNIDPCQISPSLLKLIPERVAREFLVLPLGREDDLTIVAAADPSSTKVKGWLDRNLSASYRLVLAGRYQLLEAITRAYNPAIPRRLLGELLLQAGVIAPEQLKRALELQKGTGQKLGEVLEAMGVVSHDLLAQKIREQQEASLPMTPAGSEADETQPSARAKHN